MRPPVLVLALCLSVVACDDTTAKVEDAAKTAKKSAEDAAKKTTAAIDDAQKKVDDAKKAAGDASKQAGDLIDSAKSATAKAWAGLTDTGELSKGALEWLSSTTDDVDIKKVLAKGAQVAPVALEIAKTVNAAVDSETAIEPIYQSLDGRDPAEVDKAISSMARVEVIDGLKVGFNQLSRTDASTKVDETAYLVTWRHEDHLVGFVYRTKRTIDIDMLVKEAPRLIKMTKAAIEQP
ncbi:MAG TPA: hypothetical protein VG755_04120 [Nannocystaceae bacterium]|nr:hypothetical protein [Nannocystaceae bacterium]